MFLKMNSSRTSYLDSETKLEIIYHFLPQNTTLLISFTTLLILENYFFEKPCEIGNFKGFSYMKHSDLYINI